MRYTKHTMAVVVSEQDNEIVAQALTDALERLGEVQGVTVYSTESHEEDAPEPENAVEIGEPVN